VRRRNAAWLQPWEATTASPMDRQPTFGQMVRKLRAQARHGEVLPFALTYDGRLCGQVTVAGIVWGSACSATIGYWVDQQVAGRGVMPTAVALVTDHCFGIVGLHRIEINIRPENGASRRVVEKLGFRAEGLRLRLLHINGEWADHLSYALTAEEVPDGLHARWVQRRVHQP
jgi:ribosomal-protein-alanine N-acetyltransferase